MASPPVQNPNHDASGLSAYLLPNDKPTPPARGISPANSQSGLELNTLDADFEVADEEYNPKASTSRILGEDEASVKKAKKPQWVPPPTYPYNLIPGRDLLAMVVPNRPKFPDAPSSSTGPAPVKNASAKTKSTRQRRKPSRADGVDEDDLEEEEFMDDYGKEESESKPIKDQFPTQVTAILGIERQKAREKEKEQARLYAEQHGGQLPPPPSPPKPKPVPPKPVAKSTKEKGKEKERTTKDDKPDRFGQKSKSGKSSTSKSNKPLDKLKKSDKSSSSSKTKPRSSSHDSRGRNEAFAANQGVRLENARGAVIPDYESEEELEEEVIDTHLYCVCKSLYDDNSLMIACDQCDEWYHPRCVSLVEADLELVDLFICPPCITAHPHLHTTFKVACSFTTCRKPARLPLSKFCSDECGISCVMERVDQWSALESAQAEVNGNSEGPEPWERLHECSSIRQAKRREGIVVVESESFVFSGGVRDGKHEEDQRTVEKYGEIVDRLRIQREEKLREIASVRARLVLMSIAVERAELRGISERCMFDKRVLMDEGDWEEWVESEDGRRAFEGGGTDGEEDAEELKKWLCQGKKKCDRHAGWQKARMADFELEKDVLEKSLAKLSTREGDLLGRMDDIMAVSTPPDTGGMMELESNGIAKEHEFLAARSWKIEEL